MTVQQLIDELQQIEDKTLKVMSHSYSPAGGIDSVEIDDDTVWLIDDEGRVG